MFNMIEKKVVTALSAITAPAVTVTRGPAEIPEETSGLPHVQVYLSLLSLTPYEQNHTEKSDEDIIYSWKKITYTGDGTKDIFTVPADVDDSFKVSEIESPRGTLCLSGTDFHSYSDDQGVKHIQFRRPPLNGQDITVLLRGQEQAGYEKRESCSVELIITCTTANQDDLDTLMPELYSRALLSLSELQVIPLAEYSAGNEQNSQVLSRLLNPSARFNSLEKQQVTGKKGPLIQGIYKFLITGEYQLHLSKGARDEAGIIEEVNLEKVEIFPKK